jgi:hypothetical protein
LFQESAPSAEEAVKMGMDEPAKREESSKSPEQAGKSPDRPKTPTTNLPDDDDEGKFFTPAAINRRGGPRLNEFHTAKIQFSPESSRVNNAASVADGIDANEDTSKTPDTSDSSSKSDELKSLSKKAPSE